MVKKKIIKKSPFESKKMDKTKNAEKSIPLEGIKTDKKNNLELYLNDVFENECVIKASEEEVEFIQTGIETLVQKIVDLVIDDSLPDLERQLNEYVKKKKLVEVYFNFKESGDNSRIKIARKEIIKVGSFYEGTKNNFPDEFDLIFPVFYVQEESRDNLTDPFKRIPKHLSPQLHSSIHKATTKNKTLLNFQSEKVQRKLRFDQYVRLHGPASMLRFIYIDSRGDKRNIHVDLVPADRITLKNIRSCFDDKHSSKRDCDKFSFRDEVVSRKNCLVIANNLSFTETEVHLMKTVLSQKHRKVYRILKFLINGHGDGEIFSMLHPKSFISSYRIKMMMIDHHDECSNPDTKDIGDCLIKILDKFCEIESTEYEFIMEDTFVTTLTRPYLMDLKQSFRALQATEDPYSYDQIRMKSISRHVVDGMDRKNKDFDFWFRYLAAVGKVGPRIETFEEFLDAEIPGWRRVFLPIKYQIRQKK